MERMQAATDRLEQAIADLERVVQARIAQADRAGSVAAVEELHTVRAQYTRLCQATDTVASRLNLTIDRLKSVLES